MNMICEKGHKYIRPDVVMYSAAVVLDGPECPRCRKEWLKKQKVPDRVQVGGRGFPQEIAEQIVGEQDA